MCWGDRSILLKRVRKIRYLYDVDCHVGVGDRGKGQVVTALKKFNVTLSYNPDWYEVDNSYCHKSNGPPTAY